MGNEARASAEDVWKLTNCILKASLSLQWTAISLHKLVHPKQDSYKVSTPHFAKLIVELFLQQHILPVL